MTEPAQIADDARPRLAPKVRLRFDRHAQKYLLVYPDRGMELNASAAAIAQLCTGEYTVAEIVSKLAAAEGDGASRAQITNDVHGFLGALLERGLLGIEAR